MDQLDYKKKYNEALERAKYCLTTDMDNSGHWATKYIFPELKESDDVQHRKWILEYLYDGLRKSDEQFKCQFKCAIDWLEKQGEQKETLCDKCRKDQPSHFCQDITALGRCAVEHEQKPADKDEHKFKVGDWIVIAGRTGQIIFIQEKYIVFHDTDGKYVLSDSPYRLWTIKDAKDGDVLYCKKRDIDNSEIIMMYSGINIHNHVDSYCRYSSELGFNAYIISVLDVEHDFIIPATKEQRDQLFSKMREAGYEWDAEKKELKKIEQKPVEWQEEQIKQKAKEIAWQISKHYDPNACKQEWCEMAAMDMACWMLAQLKKGGNQ